jgi:micrococcal nuclease
MLELAVTLELAYPVPRSYPAKMDRVVDGDTVVLDVDVGFDVWIKAKCRLARINAPEMREEAGYKSLLRLREMVAQVGDNVWRAEIVGRDKYGRWLLNLYVSGGTCINDMLVKEGFAVHI